MTEFPDDFVHYVRHLQEGLKLRLPRSITPLTVIPYVGTKTEPIGRIV